jgi:hypothetical protein
VLVVVSWDGQHHDAATTTWNIFCRNDRFCSLRLYPHAETKKKATRHVDPRLLCQDDLNPGDSTEVYHDEALRIAAKSAQFGGQSASFQMSTCSAIVSASSTSMPR